MSNQTVTSEIREQFQEPNSVQIIIISRDQGAPPCPRLLPISLNFIGDNYYAFFRILLGVILRVFRFSKESFNALTYSFITF